MNGRKQISLRIKPELYEEIKKESERTGINVHTLIVLTLRQKFVDKV